MTFPTSRLTMSTAMMAAALTAAPLKGQVIPGPGTAAEPETSLESADSEIADIVITGRKRARSETLQSVPLSITALGAAQLAEPIVATLIDVGRLTPNASLQTSSQRGIQNFSIRGMGISGSTPSDEPAVGCSHCLRPTGKGRRLGVPCLMMTCTVANVR